MGVIEDISNAPWPQLIQRSRESGPYFLLRYLSMLRRHRRPLTDIRQYQERRLRRILRHAVESVPAYRYEFYERATWVRDGWFRALEQLPTIDRGALVEGWGQFVAQNAKRYSPKLRRTGGTTGTPVTVYLDGRTRAIWNMMFLLRLQWAGVAPGDRSVVFGMSWGDLPGSIPESISYRYDRSRRELFLNGVRSCDDRRLREFAGIVVEFRPHFIRGNPSLLTLLARAISSLRAGLKLRAVLTGGELLDETQRALLEETFHCKVFDHYNMWEMVAFAAQCERGSYHLIPELSCVEILQDGHPCGSGEVGEIVGTHLENYAMPLIRYNMKDMASLNESLCMCGRNTQIITLMGGKGRDLLVTPRRYVAIPAGRIARIVPPVPVEKMQFYQDRRDGVLVRIVRGKGYVEDDTRRLIAEIDRILEGEVKIRWEYVDDIPRTPSGKFPYVVCKVPLELR